MVSPDTLELREGRANGSRLEFSTKGNRRSGAHETRWWRLSYRGKTYGRPLLVTLAIFGIILTGIAWAISSPVGASPDDDHHLGSIWCPRPIEDSGCTIVLRDDASGHPEEWVGVPETVGNALPCYASGAEKSAVCEYALSDARKIISGRYDAGGYPIGYYHFHHLFVGSSVERSVITMRIVNLLIAVATLAVTAITLPYSLRTPFIVAMLVAWVPMGLYFISSNNPSSWAITGVMTYCGALVGIQEVSGNRRRTLIACALFGSILCFTSRGDAALFIAVISLSCIPLYWKQGGLRKRMLSTTGVLSLIGLFVMWSLGGTGRAVGFLENHDAEPLRVRLAGILLSLPEYVAGMLGRRWGAGWFTVPFDGPATVISLMLLGGVLMIGISRCGRRAGAAAVLIGGALLGIPIVVALTNRWDAVYTYQPRYQLPLLAPFIFVLLSERMDNWFTGGRKVVMALGSSLVQAIALHTVIGRYTHGLDPMKDAVGNLLHDLDFQAWWWPTWIPVPPMVVFGIGAGAFACSIVVVVILLSTGERRNSCVGRARAAAE